MHCRPLRLIFLLASLGHNALWSSEALAASGLSDADSFLNDRALRENKDPAHSAVLEHRAQGFEECRPTGPIETTLCDYETLESVNEKLFSNLHQLVEMPFFRYFMVDLYRECPFWEDDGQCNEMGCAITSVDESEVPERWRASALSKVDSGKVEDTHRLTGCYYRDSDFCLLEDNTEGEYYDLALVPERYTGYSGRETQRIWAAIYDENCFGVSESTLSQLTSTSQPGQLDSSEDDALCLEKRVYYKVVSGLHASISTHLCAEYLNQSTGNWGPNLNCFLSRLSPSKFPERIPNIYFNTVLLLRAVSRISPYLKSYDYCSSGTHEEDTVTLQLLDNVADVAREAGRFDESGLFQGLDSIILKEEFKEHFRNVTRIMDCVGCGKCRLWGKVQTTGLATALKILFEMDDRELELDPKHNPDLLSRSELVALFNTLHRFSESLHAIDGFREMMLDAASHSSASSEPSPKLSGSLHDRMHALLSLCKESTRSCIETMASLWYAGVKLVKGIVNPQGKRHGPGFSEL